MWERRVQVIKYRSHSINARIGFPPLPPSVASRVEQRSEAPNTSPNNLTYILEEGESVVWVFERNIIRLFVDMGQ